MEKKFYKGQKVIACNNNQIPVDDDAGHAPNLIKGQEYTIDQYLRFHSNKWWVTVKEIDLGCYTEDEFVNAESINQKELEIIEYQGSV